MYTIYDIYKREYLVEPLICLFCGSSEVTYLSEINDASCENCGVWQFEKWSNLPIKEARKIAKQNNLNIQTYRAVGGRWKYRFVYHIKPYDLLPLTDYMKRSDMLEILASKEKMEKLLTTK